LKNAALKVIDALIAAWNPWDPFEECYLTVVVAAIVRSSDARRQEEEARRHEQARQHEEEERRRRQKREQQERKRRQAEETRLARKRALVARIKDVFETDFLTADAVLAADPDASLLSAGEYDDLKAPFVRAWAEQELRQQLDSEQAAAVGTTAGDVQVVARAGSGKTRTLVTRAIFLQKHCGVSPRELLLLAFNKKAADEMKERLAKVLGKDLPHVMTFHALAYALVQPEQELLVDDPSADQLGLSREVQEVIDEHIRSREYGDRIRDLMLAHFREDWERIVDGRFQPTLDDFLAHHRALPRESLNGEWVKSFGEKVIANALFEHGVPYRYERNFRWNGVNYRPDFTIPIGPNGGVVIEYFGLSGDAEYDEMSQEKRAFWAERPEWTFLEFSPRDLAQNGEGSFIDTLLRKLQNAGVSWRRRSEKEIWQLVGRRALDRFTAATRTFVSRGRKRNLSLDDLQSMVAAHTACTTAERLFLEVGFSVYEGYLTRLATRNKEDFDGLMWRSAALVRAGHTRFVRDKGKEQGDLAHLRFVMIDEFQDFSEMFFELISAIRSANPDVRFFCVGDDWQAINGFAGSDLGFFGGFALHFRDTSRRYIGTNYRSPVSVVEAGNALMRGRGEEAYAARSDDGAVWLCNLDGFVPSWPEQARHNGDEITPAVLRLSRRFLDGGLDVVMLSRRNGLPWYVNYRVDKTRASGELARFLEHVRSHLPEEDRRRVTASTAHRYKGLEQSAVIVLDAVEGSYPLIHPNWVFLRVFGDSVDRIEDEERRLFYVAVTRARDRLALLTETSRQSPYVGEIQHQVRLTPLLWADLPPAPSLDGARLEIRVSNSKTYAVKDQLKDLGYRWNGPGQYWSKAVPDEGFSFDDLMRQRWAASGVSINVYTETGELLYAT